MPTSRPASSSDGRSVPGAERILTPDALAFVADLQRRFGPVRLELLRQRHDRQADLDAGDRPDFLAEQDRT